MTKNFTTAVSAAAFLLLTASGTTAQAQILPEAVAADALGISEYENQYFDGAIRGESVFVRPRPDNTPLNIRAGSFLIAPAINFQTEFDSNIFDVDDSAGTQESDVVAIVNPGVRIQSDWNRHSLTFRGGFRAGELIENSEQSYTDILTALNGVYDIKQGVRVLGGASYQRLHEDRGDPNSLIANTFAPTEYNLSVFNVGLDHDTGLLGLELRGDYLRWDYEDVPPTNNDDRDRDEFVGSVRLDYEFKRGYEIFVKGTFTEISYDDKADDNGFRRDSIGVEGVVGADFDVSNLVTGEIYGGFGQRNFDDTAFNNVETVLFGTNLLWNATDLTSVRATVDRFIRDSVSFSTSAYIETAYAVIVEHELRRNLLVGAEVSHSHLDFEGQDIIRKDDLYEASLGARYFIGRNIVLGGDYTYRRRNSNIFNQDFVQNSVVGTLGFKF